MGDKVKTMTKLRA